MIFRHQFTSIAALLLFVVVNLSLAENEADIDLSADLENWMSKLPEPLKTMPLHCLAIPGSHDSFTKSITRKSGVSPDGMPLLKKISFLRSAMMIMANWSKTQALDVLGQLLAGIRYFDLRFCRNFKDEHNLRFCHGMFATEVTSVFNNITTFLNSHPQEVVILDCQHFYNFSDHTHSVLIKQIHDTFRDKLVRYEQNLDSLTLKKLNEEKKQVIVVYRDYNQDKQDLLWPNELFHSPWFNTMNPEYLITSLDEAIHDRDSNTFFISQLILTPQVETIAKNFIWTLKGMCAIKFESARSNWILKQSPGQFGVNIIMGDFVDLKNNYFSRVIVNLNLKNINMDMYERAAENHPSSRASIIEFANVWFLFLIIFYNFI